MTHPIPIIRFTGRDRSGRPVGGACSGRRPDRLAEMLYNRGWRQLVIIRDGMQVGGIGPHPDTGYRILVGRIVSRHPDTEEAGDA